ncbi:MAG TPA: cytochrome c biogenesis protein ResB [Coriobacteriia bacterium]
MIHALCRRTVKFLSSAGLAVWLLTFVGLWSATATAIPQGGSSDPLVAAWASKYPLIEPLVRVVGLHQAFTSPAFALCVLVLAVSTALCAWQRTRAAVHRGHALGQAAIADQQSVIENHDLEIQCDSALSKPEVLSIASRTLGELEIRTKRRGDVLSAVSPSWAVVGSPVFHWALLALIVVIFASNLQRSEGLMGLAVGQTKLDVPASYGRLRAGPLYDWSGVRRSIRVDAFDLQYQTGGTKRGPTPTVSVLDGEGRVLKTQRVYPNMMLRTGSLAIYPSAYGFAATISIANTSGVETGRSVQLVDFSDTAADGTVSSGSLAISDRAGNAELNVSTTVPLERVGAQVEKSLPEKPTARVVVTSPSGEPLVDRIVSPGEDVALPSGDILRVEGIGYYARLQVVDDWSTNLLYACLAAATIGLTIAFVARQQIVLATVIDGPEGARLAVRLRLWRNESSSRSAVERELARALGQVEKGSAS